MEHGLVVPEEELWRSIAEVVADAYGKEKDEDSLYRLSQQVKTLLGRQQENLRDDERLGTELEHALNESFIEWTPYKVAAFLNTQQGEQLLDRLIADEKEFFEVASEAEVLIWRDGILNKIADNPQKYPGEYWVCHYDEPDNFMHIYFDEIDGRPAVAISKKPDVGTVDYWKSWIHDNLISGHYNDWTVRIEDAVQKGEQTAFPPFCSREHADNFLQALREGLTKVWRCGINFRIAPDSFSDWGGRVEAVLTKESVYAEGSVRYWLAEFDLPECSGKESRRQNNFDGYGIFHSRLLETGPCKRLFSTKDHAANFVAAIADLNGMYGHIKHVDAKLLPEKEPSGKWAVLMTPIPIY